MEQKTQKRSHQKKRKLQVQTELIQQQKEEIENLKASLATKVSQQQLVSAILQEMSYLFVGNKKTTSDNNNTGGKKFLGTSRPPKSAMGTDGSLDINLICWYCKDTGHKLENCKQLQCKLAHECMTMQGVVTEELLNVSHH